MYDAKFKTFKAAQAFYESRIAEGISAYPPQRSYDDAFPWKVRTIET